MSPRVVIVGAGPIGLEAAIAAAHRGWNVAVYERGSVAENVRQWGHVRLFSPFGMNGSEWGRSRLSESRHDLPSNETLLTGHEFVEQYLLPLSRLPELTGRIREGVMVRAIGRPRHWKGDDIGQSQRNAHGFRLLLERNGREEFVSADYVLDCSGTYRNHNWLGGGGLPCLGERACLEPSDYCVPDVLGRDRNRFAGRTTLVVGSGYSAATTIVSLAALAESEPNTRAVWLTRTDRTPPMQRIAGDQLSERDRLAAMANQLAQTENEPISWRPATVVQRIEKNSEPSYRVTIKSFRGETTDLLVDRIVANVGYRPDRSVYEELQVHECYATQGPMKLAAALLGETSADCLSRQCPGADALRNPEPGFFILGAKSYGRDSRFLLRIGFEQVQQVLAWIETDWTSRAKLRCAGGQA